MAVMNDKQLTEALRITGAAIRVTKLMDTKARIAANQKLTARLQKLNEQIKRNK